MAAGNNDTSSQPLAEERTTAKRLRLTTTSSNHQPIELPVDDALNAPPDTAPMELIAEILVRLPVKSLLRFMSVCKPWDALISDPQFAKQQLRASASDPNRHHLIVTSFYKPSRTSVLMDYSLRSLLNSSSPPSSSRRNRPFEYQPFSSYYLVGSCRGMLCVATLNRRYRDPDHPSPFVWNPSTGKLNDLPPFNCQWKHLTSMEYGFGYDHLSDSYKVAAVYAYDNREVGVYETVVVVHTLGTDSWRPIQKFPDPFVYKIEGSGGFVNGKLNWLVRCYNERQPLAIVSLDLGTETYQQLLPPDDCLAHVRNVDFTLTTDELKGCLCMLARCDDFSDVWVMKDYGNNESWTKLFNLPYSGISPFLCPLDDISRPLCISDEGDEILLQLRRKSNLVNYSSKTRAWQTDYELDLVVYNSKCGTVKNPRIKRLSDCIAAVYTESLISPCF